MLQCQNVLCVHVLSSQQPQHKSLLFVVCVQLGSTSTGPGLLQACTAVTKLYLHECVVMGAAGGLDAVSQLENLHART